MKNQTIRKNRTEITDLVKNGWAPYFGICIPKYGECEVAINNKKGAKNGKSYMCSMQQRN